MVTAMWNSFIPFANSIAALASAVAACAAYLISRQAHDDRSTPVVAVTMKDVGQEQMYTMGVFPTLFCNVGSTFANVTALITVIITDRDAIYYGSGAYSGEVPVPLAPRGEVHGFFVWRDHISVPLDILIEEWTRAHDKEQPFDIYFKIKSVGANPNGRRRHIRENPELYYLYKPNRQQLEAVFYKNPEKEIDIRRKIYKSIIQNHE